MVIKKAVLILILQIVYGCAFYGPVYKKPNVNLPNNWVSNDKLTKNSNINLPMLKWWQKFEDEQLAELIEKAVINNNDIQSAVGKVINAKGELLQIQSKILPPIDALFLGTTNSISAFMYQPGYNMGFLPTYALNLFQYIRSNEWARANLDEAKAAKDAVMLTVISQTAAGYFTYAGQSHLLNQQKQLVKDLQELLRLANDKYQKGLISLYTLQKYIQQYEKANAELPIIANNVVLSRNALKVLLNENPGDIYLKNNFMSLKSSDIIPSNLPSQVLRNRPDVRGAEQKLIAANANVGIVTSTFFPSITLTSIAASGTKQLSRLFANETSYFHYLERFTMPMLAPEYPGKYKSATGLRYAAYRNYVQTIRIAFKSVDDDLSAHQQYYNNLVAQNRNFTSSAKAYKLAKDSYREGLYSYPTLLVNKINMDNAAISLTKSKIAQLITIVQLYQDLGGGYAYKYKNKA